MTPRPSSPTSLLWAHQIKRENGHLLGRIQKLEATHEKHDDRLKETENATRSPANGDLAALAEQVKALDESGISERLAKVEKDVMSKLDDVQAESEAIVQKAASLDKDEAVAEDERRKAFKKEKALLKRLADVEAELKKYEQMLTRVGRRVDEQSVGTIKAQLDDLQKTVEAEGSEMKLMEESLRALETANVELRKANVRLEAEVQRLADKAALAVSLASVQPGPLPTKPSGKRGASEMELDEEAGMPPPPTKRPKQSHKWAGGGADKDIILQGSDLTRKSRATASPKSRITKAGPKPAPKLASQAAAKAKPAPRKEQKPLPKPAPPKIVKPVVHPVAPKIRKKPAASQPKAKANTAASQRSAHKGLATARSAKSQHHLDGEASKPIIRAGKGWVEVALTPSQSEGEESGERDSPERLRGRTRRSLLPQPDMQSANNTQHLTRGGRRQLVQKLQRRTIKPEPEPLSAADTPHARPSDTTEAQGIALDRLAAYETPGGVFASPPVPPRQSIEQPSLGARTETGYAMLPAVFASDSQSRLTTPPPPARPGGRR
ncbi:hypothetical protein LTR53_003255, partial [Teratosphaeriaceae sp. CCFEE 6253]